ncbi:MAG: hypothetical protein AB1414_15545 [bacterium]
MVYIALAIIGIVAVWVVRAQWSKKGQIIFLLTTLIGGLVLFICADFFLLQPPDVTQRGVSSFLAQIPWLEISLYLLMLSGMAAKYFFDAIGEEGKKIELSKWQLFRPMLVSPIVFGVVYASIGESTPVIVNLIFAFQNGFFWQTVLNRL